MSDLKVTKERVVAAAAKCGDAARVLKELFPEAFVEPIKAGDIVRSTRGYGVFTYLGGGEGAKALFKEKHGYQTNYSHIFISKGNSVTHAPSTDGFTVVDVTE